MKTFVANLPCLFCVVGAIVACWAGSADWGWFLFVALLLFASPQDKEKR